MINYKMADKIFQQGVMIGLVSGLIFILAGIGSGELVGKIVKRIEYRLLKGVTE